MVSSKAITKLSIRKQASSVSVSAEILTIEDSSFSKCKNLRSIFVDSKNSQFSSIDGILFTKNLETLLCFPAKHPFTKYTIPISVTSIGDFAFSGRNLRSIIIPKSVTSIDESAFARCFSLQSINVEPNNFQYRSIDGILFTKNLEKLLCFPATLSLSNYTIPTGVTSIGKYAFYRCWEIQLITIPTSVTSIGDSAFSGCFNLQSIAIPTSVTSIGDSAFSWCANLQSIAIPTSVTSIGDSVFSSCSSLTTINVDSDNLQYCSIDGILFTKNLETLLCFPAKLSLSNYTIPTSVKSIGNYGFSDCSQLQSITIPASVTSIGNFAFSGCFMLQSITIPTSVTSIGNSVFSSCSSLTTINVDSDNLQYCSIDGILFTKNLETLLCFPAKNRLSNYTIPSSVTSIDDGAFSKCSQLQSITIPASVTSIENNEFSDCSNLIAINVDRDNLQFSSIDGIFFTKNSETLLCFPPKHPLSEYIIPRTVTSIGDSAFLGCHNLQSVTIPTSVTFIDHYVFYMCTNLQSITIPTSVTSIGDFAFSECSNLQSITIPASVTSIGDFAFSHCSSLRSIIIPTSVTSIGQGILLGCKNLYSIAIPDVFSFRIQFEFIHFRQDIDISFLSNK